MIVDIEDILRTAEQVASKSDVRFKVSCILVDRRGRIVATGYNHHSARSSRLGLYTIHAECDAVNKVMKPSSNLVAFLYRKNNNPIHPCPCCAELLKSYGITKIVGLHEYVDCQ